MQDSPKYIVVHGGARDNYQVALALQEAGLLKTLVTDLFLPAEREKFWLRILPARVAPLLRARTAPISPSCIKRCRSTGLLAWVLERFGSVPFALRRSVRRLSDYHLGSTAGRLAAKSGSALLAYSYYGSAAFRAYGRPALLFQVHPHPLTVRRLLQEERTLHPECASSLDQEWELALPASDLQNLVYESETARAYIVASSFTRDSLIEHGVPRESISVVPYGVDLGRFHPRADKRLSDGTLRLLFVGRMNQRKGLLYLLQALTQVADLNVHLTVCGRVVDDLQLFRRFTDRVTIRPSVSAEELVEAYQQADLFVFPSVAEGFGQVLLEALACGLPVLSTTHTAAPDLIDDGVQGWIVAPRNVEELADRIRWAAQNPAALRHMATAARERAEQYTWQRFRKGVVEFLIAQRPQRTETAAPVHVELVGS